MRRVIAVLVSAFALALMPAGVSAQVSQQDASKSVVVLSGDAYVSPSDNVQSVVVFDGGAKIDGSVKGAVVVFSGPVTITGFVHGDVVAFDGAVTVAKTGHVGGDLFADKRVLVPGAQVDGTTQSTARFATAAGWASVMLWLAMAVVLALSMLLFGLLLLWLFPRVADAALDAGRTAIGPSIGWGAAMVIGLPTLAVLAMVTVIGLPVGLGVLFALGLIYTVGMIAAAWFVGRLVLKNGSRAGAYAVGWLILTAVSLVPAVGGLVWFCSAGYGLGMLCVAAYRSRTTPSAELPVKVPDAPEMPVTV
jgi:cytoskeletal protein CcmA (bactofilin family)